MSESMKHRWRPRPSYFGGVETCRCGALRKYQHGIYVYKIDGSAWSSVRVRCFR